MSKKLWWIIPLTVILVGMIVFLGRGCKTTNIILPSPNSNVSAPVKVFTQDSLRIKQQELLIVQSQGTIEALQDSIERITEKLTKVIPEYLIRYRDTIVYRDKYLLLRHDTVYRDSIPTYSLDFKDSTKWYSLQGSVSLDTLRFDRVQLYNKTSVIIGQKGSWWQPKTIVVNVAQDNPYLVSGSIQSYYFKPKERKWALLVGPSLLFNGKTFYKGVAITAGYKIF